MPTICETRHQFSSEWRVIGPDGQTWHNYPTLKKAVAAVAAWWERSK